jgi:hypothetical protein
MQRSETKGESKSGSRPSLDLRFKSGCSAIFTVAFVANVSEPVCFVQDIGIQSNFGFKMKASLL